MYYIGNIEDDETLQKKDKESHLIVTVLRYGVVMYEESSKLLMFFSALLFSLFLPGDADISGKHQTTFPPLPRYPYLPFCSITHTHTHTFTLECVWPITENHSSLDDKAKLILVLGLQLKVLMPNLLQVILIRGLNQNWINTNWFTHNIAQTGEKQPSQPTQKTLKGKYTQHVCCGFPMITSCRAVGCHTNRPVQSNCPGVLQRWNVRYASLCSFKVPDRNHSSLQMTGTISSSSQDQSRHTFWGVPGQNSNIQMCLLTGTV